MRRVPDLIDVWFDSGAMPFAQWHYPFENRDKFDTNFPADFIAEGVDQTRGWFYTLHALGNMLFDKAAYRNVVSNGLVLDAKGEKMSKSKGNTVDPFEVINEFGADATRWYMMSNSSPWENLKFSLDGLKEVQRKYLSTIMNTWSFFAMYANIDGFSYTGVPFPTADRPEMDRWIISRLNSTVKQVDEFLDQYEPTKAIRCIEEFIEELSNWYVRRSRRRFWGEGTKTEIASAYQSLLECLLALSKLVSPFAPYFAEWIYQRINEVVPQEEASVHLSFFPSVEETAINKKLEKQMLLARLITTMVLKIRNHVNINVRQPLARIMVNTASEEEHLGIEAVRAIILEEVNVKELTFVDSSSDVVTKSAQPNFKLLGKKLGKQMKEIGTLIKELDNEAIAKLEKTGTIELASTTGQVFSLNQEEILIQSAGLQGWEVESEQGLTIALDTRVTDELLTEGLAREFINRVQNMRKEADFDVTDHIDVGFVTDNDTLSAAIMKHSAYITGETLTDNLVAEALKEADFTKEWQINEFVCLISVKKNLQN